MDKKELSARDRLKKLEKMFKVALAGLKQIAAERDAKGHATHAALAAEQAFLDMDAVLEEVDTQERLLN